MQEGDSAGSAAPYFHVIDGESTGTVFILTEKIGDNDIVPVEYIILIVRKECRLGSKQAVRDQMI